jgi:hypothetical protein
VVLCTERAKAATQEILETHCIASDRSPDLQLDGGAAAVAAAANGVDGVKVETGAAVAGGAGGSKVADGSKGGS